MQNYTRLFAALGLAVLMTFSNTGCSSKAKQAYHLKRADQYFDAGQYDQAEVEYKNVIKVRGQTAHAYARLGIIYFEQGRLGLASFCLSRAPTNDLDVRVKIGFLRLGAGRLKEARENAYFVLEQRPQDSQAPLILAETAHTPAEIEETRKRLQGLIAKGDGASLQVAVGTIAFREKDLKAAETAFKHAQTLDPKSPIVYSALGALYLAQQNLKEADLAFKTAADLSPPRSLKRVQYAQFKIQNGDTTTGRKILEETVKASPDYLPAMIALAEIAASEKKYDESLALTEKVLVRDPDSYPALSLKANLTLAKGNTDEAILQLERLAKAFKDPQAYYRLGLLHLSKNEIEKALDGLRESVSLNTNFPPAIVLLADLHVKTGDVDSAVALLKKLIQQQPKVAPAQLLLASIYSTRGNLDEALVMSRQVQQLTPKDPKPAYLEGSILLQQKKNSEARAAFNKALEVAPDYLAAIEQLIDLDLIEKQYPAALQRVETLMKKYPARQEPFLLQSKIFLAQRDHPQAEAALLKAIQLDSNSIPAYLTLAQLYLDARQNQKALRQLDSALAKNPKSAEALLLSAAIRKDEKDYSGARDHYEKVLAIQPNAALALNNLAYLYSENLGEVEKGHDLARRARELNPNDPATADTLGWMLFRKGQYSSALSLLEESARKLPDDPEIQAHLGMTHYMLGAEDSASMAFQRVLQSKRQFSGREEVDQHVAILAIDPKTAGAEARASLEKRLSEHGDDPVAINRLTAIYRRDGAKDKEMNLYQTTLKANPRNLKALIGLAQLYSSNPQKTSEAFEFAKTAYRLSPDNSDIPPILGPLAYQAGDHKWAFSLLTEAARKQPGDAPVLYDKALAAYSVGQVSEAQVSMQNALRANPTFPNAAQGKRFLDVVSASLDSPPSATALSNAEQILKSDANYVPALMIVGNVQRQKNDGNGAKQTYEKVLARYPEFTPAKRELVICYSQDPSKDPKAYELGVQARQTFPEDPELAKALGIIMYRQGKDYRAAARFLADSATKRTEDGELLYYLGMARYRLKDVAGSKTALTQALILAPSHSLAGEAKRILAELK